jgi:hypothetical protein
MAVRLGAKDVRSEDDVQGTKLPKPGRYHVVVARVDESMEKGDKIIVTFEVLAGTLPGQEDSQITEWFSTTEKALPRLKRFALAVGILKPGDEEKEITFVDATNRDLVVEVEDHTYTNKDGVEKKSVRIPWVSFWSTDNAAVADVPKSEAALKLFGANRAAKTSAANDGPKTSESQDEWGNF